MKRLLKFLTGNLAGELRQAYQAKLNAQNDEDRIAAEVRIEELKHTAAVQKASMTRWEMRLIALVAGLPAAFHFAAICYDSVIQFDDWDVAALPAPYDALQVSILGGLFGISAIRRILR